MDHDCEINSLAAETLAIQHILTQVLYGISEMSPAVKDAVRLGSNDAASDLEDFAIRRGKTASPDHVVRALRVVEQLRAATLGDQDKPRPGV
jgi:hypothetical protein